MSTGAVVLSAVALSLALPATAMLLRHRAQAASSAALLCSAALVGSGAPGPAGEALAVLAGLFLAPLVALTYPRARGRHPIDFLALVILGGATAVTLVVPSALDTMVMVVILVVAGHVWWSLVLLRAPEKRAVTWLALALGSSTLAAGVTSFALGGNEGSTVWAVLPFMVVGPALYVGVSAPGVVDSRLLVVDVAAHLTTALAVLSVFVGTASALVELAPARSVSADLGLLGILTAALASAYGPVHAVLRGSIAEAVLGHRPDPLTAVGVVTRHVGDAPGEALHAVRDALALPWAAVLTQPPLSSGRRPPAVAVLPLGDGLPDLEVGLRAGDERLSRVDARLLGLAAPLLGQSVRLHALTTELRSSREGTVRALEDERLRLRRDLHDGLGPLLSGLAFTTDAARNVLRDDPVAAAALLAEVRTQAETALEDVRRLVYDMRPPALDELGLVQAVRQAVTGVRASDHDDGEVEVELDAPAILDLPAAVEVAAYRIAVGAVSNAGHHSGAHRVLVRLECRDGLARLEVRDDGGPRETPWTLGVGLSSMRERAAEVGGTLVAGPTPEGGLVVALLPVSPAARSSSSAG